MKNLDKAIKLALFGTLVGVSGLAAGADYEGTEMSWSDVISDNCRLLQVDVRFDGDSEKCLEMEDDDFEYSEGRAWDLDEDAEAFFATYERDVYGALTGTMSCDTDAYGLSGRERASADDAWIGELDGSTDWDLLKFDAKWTDAAKGNSKRGHPGNKGYEDTIEVSFTDMGEDFSCD